VEDDAAWDALVAVCPQGEVFHTTAWLRLLEEVFGVRAERLGLVHGGELVAGWPLLLRRVGPFRTLGSPFFNVVTPQMGPVWRDPALLAGLLAGFEGYQRWAGIAYCEVTFAAALAGEGLAGLGYRQDAYRTLVLYLEGRTEEDLWKGCEGRARTAVRKAQRLGVEVETAADLSFLPEYMGMAEAVYARHRHRAPIPLDFYRALWACFWPGGNLQVLLARHESRVVAAGVFLGHGQRLYYLDGVSRPEGYRLGANNLLQWQVIRWAREEGYEVYDMMGAGIPEIARFKRSFGSHLVELPVVRRTNSLPATAGLAVYRGFRPLARALAFRGAALRRREAVAFRTDGPHRIREGGRT
jgi:hypothetical protein